MTNVAAAATSTTPLSIEVIINGVSSKVLGANGMMTVGGAMLTSVTPNTMLSPAGMSSSLLIITSSDGIVCRSSRLLFLLFTLCMLF
jgi:hypothetical protein